MTIKKEGIFRSFCRDKRRRSKQTSCEGVIRRKGTRKVRIGAHRGEHFRTEE